MSNVIPTPPDWFKYVIFLGIFLIFGGIYYVGLRIGRWQGVRSVPVCTDEQCDLAESRAIQGCEYAATEINKQLMICERRYIYYKEQLQMCSEELKELRRK